MKQPAIMIEEEHINETFNQTTRIFMDRFL